MSLRPSEDDTDFKIFMIFFLAVLLIVFTQQRARAQEGAHQHPPEDAVLHDKFYSTWLQPEPNASQRVTSCCDKRDCFPAEVRKNGAQWEFMSKWTRRWTAIPSQLLEHNQPDPRESPDGRAHVCQNPNSYVVLCATLGSGT